MNKRERFVVGCMTGTSLDGIDVALTRILGSGLEMSAEFVGLHSQSIPTDLRETLMHLASGGKAEPLVFMRAARAIGELHAEAVEQLLKDHPCDRKDKKPDFIVAHGQTIWHAPPGSAARRSKYVKEETAEPCDMGMSWQLFDPWPVVKRIGVPVCYDLRQADLIAGGEGAPLTPLSDWVMYRDIFLGRYIVNLGGVVNYSSMFAGAHYSMVGAEDIVGCNLILDGVVNHFWPKMSYDVGGALAKSGRVTEVSKVLAKAIMQPKIAAYSKWREFEGAGSLGREDYNREWLTILLKTHCANMTGEDVLANLIDAIAMRIAGLVDDYFQDQVVLAGGSCKNAALVDSISEKSTKFGAKTILSDALGIPCEAREAMGFAVLGALSQDGVPISLPQVTGAKDPGIAGVWAGVGNL